MKMIGDWHDCPWGCCDPVGEARKVAKRTRKRAERQAWKRAVTREDS